MKGLILIIFAALLIVPLAAAQDAYENDNAYQNSTNIPVNGSRQTHTFHASADQDYINFTAISGSRYIIETFNKSNIDSTDTIVYLYSTDGITELASNDDIISGTIRTSRLSWNATSNGTFFLRIVEFSNNSGSTYEISVIRLGKLVPFLITPNANNEKAKFNTFNFSTGVKCYDGFCYNISAYLDPEEAADPKPISTYVAEEVIDEISKDGSANVIITLSGGNQLVEDIPQLQSRALSSLSLKRDFKVKHRYSSIPMIAGEITNEGLEKLSENLDVLSIELDRPVQIQLDGSIPQIRANNVWPTVVNNSNLTGIDQTICIIDTGINYSHSAFGSCATTSNINDGSCAKVVGGHDFVNNDNNPYDDHGHGTHVAGIAASQDATYRGVAPGARIISIKSMNSAGSGSSSDVIAGIDWCTNNASKFNISVISMSLGTNGFRVNEHCNTEAETASINNAVLNNIIVVAAAGNDDYTDGITTPACIENATSVGGVNKNDNFSFNRGFILDFAAPSNAIKSAYFDGSFKKLSGTSMATPHVAGAAAVIQQIFKLKHNRTITPKEVTHLLRYNGLFQNDIPSQTVIPRIDVLKASTAKGIIPTTIGARPFYSLSSNPSNDSCLAFISDGQTCNQTWVVNATGDINTTWEFFAVYEGKYNFNLTAAINITIVSAVTTTLNSPADNSYSIRPVIFNCSASSQSALSNISLYLGNLTSLQLNQTANITGTPNSTTFNISLPDGNHTWNCLAKNIDNKNSFANGNKTITVDATFPAISLTNQTNTLELGSLQQILVNVTDLNLNYVNISINNSNTTMNLVNGLYNYSYIPFYNETINYTIYAADMAGNINNSITGFIVNDTTNAPLFYSVSLTNATINYSSIMSIFAIILDGLNLNEALLDYNGTNVSMNNNQKYNYTYSFSPNSCGTNTYKISAKNSANFSNVTNGSFYTENCCGNTACETGESCSSCSNDCGQCASSSPAPSGGGGGGGSGGGGSAISGLATVPITNDLKPDQFVSVDLVSDNTPFTNAILELANSDIKASFSIKPVSELPNGIAKLDKTIYKIVQAETNVDGQDISSLVIKFKVENSWLDSYGIDKDNIALYRFNSGWNALQTKLTKQDDSYSYYTAESPGFSYFAIAPKNEELKTNEAVPESAPEVTGLVTEEINYWRTAKNTILYNWKKALFFSAIIFALILSVISFRIFLRKKFSKQFNKKKRLTR